MKLLKIGRDSSNNITISNPRVSTLHAEIIVLNNGDIILEDKGSMNGTMVNGQPIQPGKPISVRRGDRIEFAGNELNWNDVPMPEDNSAFAAIYGIGTNYRNEIHLTGNRISRFHATLKKGKDGKFYIQDHSKNGTMVNGQRLASGQNVRIKKSDTVICGDQVIDLTPYLGSGSSDFGKKGLVWSAIAAAIVALVVVFINIPFQRPNYSKATAYVFHQFHYVVTLEDDPYIQVMKDNGITGWPEFYEFGLDEKGEIGPMGVAAEILGENPTKYKPISITGTAFFVSDDGRMITNRHVAQPWEGEDVVNIIHEKMGELQQKVPQYYEGLFNRLYLVNNKYTVYNRRNWDIKYMTSPMKISGETDFMAVGLPYMMYNSVDELTRASTICVSKTKEVDLAVLQVNRMKIPEEARGHHINLSKAIVNPNNLKPGEMNYVYFGYPSGEKLNLDNKNNIGLTPQVYTIGLSRLPGKYEMEFQGQIFPGASGSPVLTRDGRLVGVMNKHIPNTTISIGVLAKYAVEIYNESLELSRRNP